MWEMDYIVGISLPLASPEELTVKPKGMWSGITQETHSYLNIGGQRLWAFDYYLGKIS